MNEIAEKKTEQIEIFEERTFKVNDPASSVAPIKQIIVHMNVDTEEKTFTGIAQFILQTPQGSQPIQDGFIIEVDNLPDAIEAYDQGVEDKKQEIREHFNEMQRQAQSKIINPAEPVAEQAVKTRDLNNFRK